jgi:ubiquinone/menaquinone biosynthesis C-methylase UbiE
MAVINAKPYRLTIDALGVMPGDKVLDIGCGPGQGFALLKERASLGRVFGIDQSETMLKQAGQRNRAAIADGYLELRRGAFGSLPWGDATFDKILLVNVVYFFDRSGGDISEAHRVLRPNGRLAVYATDKTTMSRWPFSRPETHRTFDASELIALLESGGFAPSQIGLKEVTLPFGVRGVIAVADKEGGDVSEQARTHPETVLAGIRLADV